MQLLGHVVFYVSVKLRAAHGIGIVLEGSRAVLACAWVPRGHDAPGESALVVGSGAVVVGVISGKAPAANLPKWAVVFVMIGRLLIALEAVGEWGGRAGALALMRGQIANASLGHSATLEAVSSIF